MDDFLLQAFLEIRSAQLAFSNGWRYGAPNIPGEVKVNDLFNMIPMNPPISTVGLTGEEVVTMLEENLERTFACDPYDRTRYVKRSLGPFRNLNVLAQASGKMAGFLRKVAASRFSKFAFELI